MFLKKKKVDDIRKVCGKRFINFRSEEDLAFIMNEEHECT